MTFQPLLLLLLSGHIIGDFYLQTDNMSKGKQSGNKIERRKWLGWHGVCYALAIAALLFPVIQFSWRLLIIFFAISISHIALDNVKRFIKWKPFIIDQILHIAVILLMWFIFNDKVTMWPYITELNALTFPGVATLNANPYWTLLGVMIILRPVGYLIKSNELWNFGDVVEKDTPHAGRMIGYLERLIVFFLILNNALGTIGFIITAKSVIRFPEIINESDKTEKGKQVEYYLIGTLLSMVCVFVVYALLRLTHSTSTPMGC
ncbi:MAG: DUF3307 domain-containing protein [Defluviitaleaceae bacterium]|nr:DUF3307 domain-containing protein [Defluviitaleaceae bacterium]